MKHSIDISIDMGFLKENEYLLTKEELGNIIRRLTVKVEFESVEEKERYLNSEYKYTTQILKEYAAAWTKEERAKKKLQLYVARRNHKDFYFKQKQEKEVA